MKRGVKYYSIREREREREAKGEGDKK